jgi:endoglucanase
MALVRDTERVARDNGIRCQRSLMLGGGQDGALIQRSRGGVRTIVLSCPVKYLHTASEMVRRDGRRLAPAR